MPGQSRAPGRATRRGGQPAGAPARPRTPSTAEQHAEWLGLLRPDGPFLALPVLIDVLPQGLDTVADTVRDRVRRGWAEVQDAPDLLGPAWLELILGELLRFPPSARTDGSSLPADFAAMRRPDIIVYGSEPSGERAPRVHVYRHPDGTRLASSRGDQPALTEQAAQLCRDTRTPLALVTNGQHWVLVHARPGEPTGTATFDADLWLEEPVLLRAFATLLAAPRVLTPALNPDGTPSTSLAALFARSADALTQVTTTLGEQVRRAVELFVAELARLDRESGGALLADVTDREIYRAALTVLMRVVFLLYAEEQRLLPISEPLYAQGYAASTLYDELETVRSLHGDEVGDRRTAAWPRLVALFTAVHSGCEYPDLRIAAHGGSLFNPARFAWLQRAAITDRVVHEMLDALLILRHRGKAAERLSYKSLDVEQIGHVYEGLLEFSCLRVTVAYVGLGGKNEPELPLTDLQEHASAGEDALRQWLADVCDLTARQVEKARNAEPTPYQLAALHAACDNDATLADQIRPYWGLLRTDLRGLPTVFPAGSVLFTQVGDRRATGTHYTPRPLAEEIVRHTLAPLCFAPGPAEGIIEPGVWREKQADELLKLKVLDPAMGSGAFLVSACRYLADVVVRAWERDGVPADVAELAGSDSDRDDLLLAARRLVAARCLYGVDRDDMAVELAKLSLWLVTLAKNRPFGFLDHALRCGDSLVGLTSTDQLISFHLDPAEGKFLNARLDKDITARLEALLGEVTELRESIESTVVQDPRDAADKAAKLAHAEQISEGLRLAADAVVGAALSTSVRAQRRPWEPETDESDPDATYDDRLTAISDKVYAVLTDTADPALRQELAETIDGWLQGGRTEPIRPLHWPLEFPEVVNRKGFSAVIGNPPFIGGKRVSGAIGVDLREYLKQRIARDKPGNADLCSYFLLRDLQVGRGGRVGIIATNTIAQGDTREVGLDQAIEMGWNIYRAEKSQRWPGTASLEVSLLWVGHAQPKERRILDGRQVSAITPTLDAQSRVTGNPFRLAANADQAFIGSYVLGMGFVLEPEQAQALIAKDARNKDVLFPYLNGEDLNTRPDCSARRWVINFHDWSLKKAQEYPDCLAIIERTVKPERADKNPRTYAGLMDRWWLYWRRRGELLGAIEGLDRVLTIALVSRLVMPMFVSSHQVLSHKLGVFATDRPAHLTLLSSAFHSCWAWKNSSTMKTDLNYSPSDVYETLPQSAATDRMDRVGARLDSHRRPVMLRRAIGLTKLYNLVHDPGVTDPEIQRLRDIHVEIDDAVADAYGWAGLPLGHGFHETRQGTRFTIAPEVQVEILDRLLELNHRRHDEELRSAPAASTRARARKAAATRTPSSLSSTTTEAVLDDGLFPLPDALF